MEGGREGPAGGAVTLLTAALALPAVLRATLALELLLLVGLAAAWMARRPVWDLPPAEAARELAQLVDASADILCGWCMHPVREHSEQGCAHVDEYPEAALGERVACACLLTRGKLLPGTDYPSTHWGMPDDA